MIVAIGVIGPEVLPLACQKAVSSSQSTVLCNPRCCLTLHAFAQQNNPLYVKSWFPKVMDADL